jgi:hypothetical protein
VWRLDTADGSWAVQVPSTNLVSTRGAWRAGFQEAASAVGASTPQVRRTAEGCVFATIEGRQVRVYEWVDLHAPDVRLDATRVGAVVAAIHRVSITDPSPLDPWYHEPLGTERWDHLIGQLLEARAPFAGRPADLRDELVALEASSQAVDPCETATRI